MDLKPYLAALKQQAEPYKQQLLQRWKGLARRERYLVAGLGGFIILLMFYQIIYSPLANGVNNYRQELIKDQELLVFMQTAAPRIQMAKGQFKPEEVLTEDLLLPTVENTLNNDDNLMTFVSELSLNETNEVNVQFKDVDFDELVLWLVDLRQKYGIVVQQLTAIPGPMPGIGNVTMQLALQG